MTAPTITKSKIQTPTTPRVETTVGGTKVSVPAQKKEVEKAYHVFYHTLKSCKMVTETGRTISFVDGRYVTDVQDEIDYLQKEIALGSGYLSVIPGQEVMTSSQLDPMQTLRAKFREELLAELAAGTAAGKTKDGGATELQKLTPGNTGDIASVAAGSAQ